MRDCIKETSNVKFPSSLKADALQEMSGLQSLTELEAGCAHVICNLQQTVVGNDGSSLEEKPDEK